MIKLNLTGGFTDINYKISNFPDGQSDITILTELHGSECVTIQSYFRSFKDLELILACTTALKRMGIKVIELFIPYLLGARSDRQFVYGGTSYLVDVIAPILNAQNYTCISVLDAHSDVAAACIKNLKVLTQSHLMDYVMRQFKSKDVVLVSPDGGSLKKIYDVASYFLIRDIAIGNKHRDVISGNITGTSVTIPKDCQNKSFIVLDDLCDGGRTFVELSKALQSQGIDVNNIYLAVSHGVFSKGVGELALYFRNVFTTNSYPSEAITVDFDGFVKVKKVI